MKSTPERRAARRAMQHAVDDGRLVRSSSCRSCDKAVPVQGHHHLGYAAEHQLDIVWLCRLCHEREHNQTPRRYASEPVAPKPLITRVTAEARSARHTEFMREWRQRKATDQAFIDRRRELDRQYRDRRRLDPAWRERQREHQRAYVARKVITQTESPA